MMILLLDFPDSVVEIRLEKKNSFCSKIIEEIHCHVKTFTYL